MNRRTIVEMNYNHKDTRKRAEMRQELYEKSKRWEAEKQYNT